MAWENLGKCVSLPAAGDLSSSQYRFVTINSSGQVAAAGDGLNAHGILQDDPAAAGRAGSVMIGPGVSKVVAGGATTVGAEGASDSQGRAVDAITGDVVLGYFLEAATQAGQIVAFLWQGGKATT